MKGSLVDHAGWKKITAAALTLLGIGFLLALAWDQRDALSRVLLTLRPMGVGVAVLMLVASNASSATLFAVLARSHGAPESRRSALAGGFMLSQVAKYVPGRVWGVVVQGLLMGAGASLRTLIVANVEVALVVLGAVTAVGLALAGGAVYGPWVSVLLLAGSWLALLGMVRGRFLALVVARLQGWLPARFQSVGAAAAPRCADTNDRWLPLALVCLLVFYASGWLILLAWGLAMPLDDSIKLTALLSVSYALGVLSLLPAGIGAREAAFVGLGHLMHADMPTLAAVAIVTRLVMILGDFASLPLGWMMWAWKPREH
jgi:uncharacterized membrane protein YbhN (UPF0104 family)